MLEARDIALGDPVGGEAREGKTSAPPVLDGLTLAVGAGELVCVVGPNGAGKSTLASVLCGTVAADSGSVTVDGREADGRELHLAVGRVRQDPESQLVAPVVFDEVAFGPCNLGLAEAEVRERVADALVACGLAGFEARAVAELSGGEKQRLALAGVLAMRPRYLVLDEVTAQLDPASRREVMRAVREAVSRGVGAVLVTHDRHEVAAASRVALLERGCVTWEGTPRAFLEDAGLRARARVLGPDEVRTELARRVEAEDGARAASARGDCARAEARGLVLDAVSVSYDGPASLDGVSIEARSGRVTLLAGRSGSGKTTAIRVAAGLLHPDGGTATLAGRAVRPGAVGYVQQRAEDQLFCDTVLGDVIYGPRNLGAGEDEARARAEGALGTLGLGRELWGRSPFALSGGQRRRAAIAGVLAMGAGALVLDEPTNGLDGEGRLRTYRLARAEAERGHAVLVSSHDVEEWLQVADDVALLEDGRLVWSGPAERFDLERWERG